MRYQMKQKLFAWGDDFVIKGDDGNDAFFVDGKAFSLGKQLSFQDMSGRELAFIKQKLLAWGPTYEIYRDGNRVAVIKKELFTFFHCTFTVDVPGPDDLTAEGEFTGSPVHAVARRSARRDRVETVVHADRYIWRGRRRRRRSRPHPRQHRRYRHGLPSQRKAMMADRAPHRRL